MMLAKSKKKIKIILTLLILFIFFIIVYFIFFFKLFDVKMDLLVSFYLVGSKNRIEIYYQHSNATINESIQVIKINEFDKRTTLKIIEDYELVKKIKIFTNNSFELELGDNYSTDKSKTDSVFVVNVK